MHLPCAWLLHNTASKANIGLLTIVGTGSNSPQSVSDLCPHLLYSLVRSTRPCSPGFQTDHTRSVQSSRLWDGRPCCTCCRSSVHHSGHGRCTQIWPPDFCTPPSASPLQGSSFLCGCCVRSAAPRLRDTGTTLMIRSSTERQPHLGNTFIAATTNKNT